VLDSSKSDELKQIYEGLSQQVRDEFIASNEKQSGAFVDIQNELVKTKSSLDKQKSTRTKLQNSKSDDIRNQISTLESTILEQRALREKSNMLLISTLGEEISKFQKNLAVERKVRFGLAYF
jgi:hypothetical protein